MICFETNKKFFITKFENILNFFKFVLFEFNSGV